MPHLKPTELAYLAGFIDADGHIGLVRRKKTWADGEGHYVRPIIQIGQAKPEILREISGLLGAGEPVRYERRGVYPMYNLRLYTSTLRWLLPALSPHLRVKRRQAEVVLEFILDCKYKGKKLTTEQIARREALRAEIEVLNRKATIEIKLLRAQQESA